MKKELDFPIQAHASITINQNNAGWASTESQAKGGWSDPSLNGSVYV
jgi:hypothetical protein